MKGEILINICMLCHNFLEKGFLRSLMPLYKPDIIGSYKEPCLLLFPQEKLLSKQGVTDFFQTLHFVCYVKFCGVMFILWVSNNIFAHEKHYLGKN